MAAATVATTMIDRCKKLHREENLSSCSYSAFCTYSADMHHASMMSQIGGRKEVIDLALRLPRRWLQCRRGCSSSPPRLVIPVFRNLVFGPKKPFLTGFLRISFFLHFLEEFFTGTWFWRGSQEFLFFLFLQGFFAGIPMGQESLYLPRIPEDSCSRQKLQALASD